jgi:hypothetical protein
MPSFFKRSRRDIAEASETKEDNRGESEDLGLKTLVAGNEPLLE